ncbi:NAD-dependent succinate-semialdehyde dehydrogenase [Patescibacteria group bacterium]|nr:NAD-dependent succinate-semialdehyde dehydrogenase [Patescibacteria group bacterium]
MFTSLNPATEELLGEWPDHTADDVERKLTIAQTTFQTWKHTTIEQRSQLFRVLANNLRTQARTLGELATREMGKTITSAMAEIEKCALGCEYYAAQTANFLAPEVIETDASRSEIRYEPLGPILAVMPWNFPFWQVLRFAAPALMAGNVGLLKHASNVPQCALALEKLFLEAGFPEGVFQTLLVRASAIEGIIRDPRIKAVTLTGSEPAGRDVGRIAGEEIKPSVLELGGSDPFIIFPDADLDLAVSTAITARLQNNGQSCIAAKRFLIHTTIAEAFTKKFIEGFEAMKIGDPMDESTQIGPLASAKLRTDLDDQVKRSVAAGARILTGGKYVGDKGFFYAPTILADVKSGVPAYHEELFGPVATLMIFETLPEAINLANDTDFGLGASVWTKDVDIIEHCSQNLEAGSVFVNGMVKSIPSLPFGGLKHSGYGRELGWEGMRAFLNVKSVWVK